jgi:hypothetical protein
MGDVTFICEIVAIVLTICLASLGFKCLLLRRRTLQKEVASNLGLRRILQSYATEADAERSSVAVSLEKMESTVAVVLRDDRSWCYLWTALLGVEYSALTCAMALLAHNDGEGFHGNFLVSGVVVYECIIAITGFCAIASLVFSVRDADEVGRLFSIVYVVTIAVTWLDGAAFIVIFLATGQTIATLSTPVAFLLAVGCVARALALPQRLFREKVVLAALSCALAMRGVMTINAVQNQLIDDAHPEIIWFAIEVATAAPLATGILFLHWR